MTEIGAVDAKAHFSDLLRRVAHHGEEFVVTLRGKPAARLSPLPKAAPTEQDITELLTELRVFRAKLAARGTLLAPGESWKDYAREGLE